MCSSSRRTGQRTAQAVKNRGALKKSARNFGSILIGIETGTPEDLDLLCQRLEANGIGYRDITRDPVLAEFLI